VRFLKIQSPLKAPCTSTTVAAVIDLLLLRCSHLRVTFAWTLAGLVPATLAGSES